MINSSLNSKIVSTVSDQIDLALKYQKYYIDSGPNTDRIVDTGTFIDLKTGLIERKTVKTTVSSPRAAVLVKKKAFSSLRDQNDLRWMSQDEIMFLRASKALFALKVQQIRAYESLYKVQEFSRENDSIVNISNVISLIDKVNRLNSLSLSGGVGPILNEEQKALIEKFAKNLSDFNLNYEEKIEDILGLLKRNIYSQENFLTTFIVDYNNISNYGTGPGTGVIEISNFQSLSCSLNTDSNPSTTSVTIEDPYSLSLVTEFDIDCAIKEALTGTMGIFKGLLETDLMIQGSYDSMGFPSYSENKIVKTQMSSSLSSKLESFYSEYKRKDSSVDVDHILERMRVFYLGKSYVNPADTVNIFMQSRSRKFSKAGESVIDDMIEDDNSISPIVLEAERQIYTSGNITLKEYGDIRRNNEYSLGMIHVFAGLVTDCSNSYSQGKYNFSFNCIDNMGWLTWARFNESPSLEDPQGILEDPLTPFKMPKNESGEIDYNRSPELLDENKELVESGLLSYDSGILRGKSVTESNIFQNEFTGIGSSDGNRIMQHANGFIYNWKSGIVTATAKFEPSDGDSRARSKSNIYSTNYVLPVVKNVLNNLDVANIISVLTTGKPYNVLNFLKNSKQALNFLSSVDRGALKNISQDPLSSVVEIIKKQNKFYGNFHPYKMITAGSQSYQAHVLKTSIKDTAASQVRELELKRAEIRDRIDKLSSISGGILDSDINLSTDNIKKRLEVELTEITDKINKEVSSLGSLNGTAEDNSTPYLNINFFGSSESGDFLGMDEDSDAIKRAKSLVGSMRRIEDVRLNRDKNYFIVSDQYDASVEVKPFLLELKNSGYKLFQSSYANTFDQCRQAASFLNLEFFCNSQGHLELRPPQWNRIPLTVLKSLIKTKKMSGKNVIPDYISNMYETKEKNIVREIQRLNVRTVIICLLMGKFPDASVIPGMRNVPFAAGAESLSFFGVSISTFLGGDNKLSLNKGFGGFLGSDSIDRSINSDQRNSIASTDDSFAGTLNFDVSSENVLFGDVETVLGDFSPELSGEFKGVGLFKKDGDTFAQPRDGATLGGSGLINEILLYSKGSVSPPAEKYAKPVLLNKLRVSFIDFFGQDPCQDIIPGRKFFEESDFVFRNSSSESYVQKVNKLIGGSSGSGSLLAKLEETISSRDKSVILLRNNREKRKSFEKLNEMYYESDPNENLEDSFTKIAGRIEDGLSYIMNKLDYRQESSSPHEELIEDDTSNLLGYGSGKRFIVKDEDIISASYSERSPDFTRVNVTGSAELGIDQALNAQTEGFYFWAGAADFDMWRQYGYKSQPFNVPFFSSAENQCKPYSHFLLQMQRSKINTGTLQVVGNEFYQPGDTIYIESRGLLYYVNSVQHNFSYGGSFVTSLGLSYGHPPGVYMPNPLDLFGMQLTANIANQTIPVFRSTRGDDYYRELTPESTLLLPNASGFSDISKLLRYSDNQARFFNMMMGLNSGSVIGGNKKLLIRGFVKTEDDGKISNLNQSLEKIRDLFSNPQILAGGQQENSVSIGDFAQAASEGMIDFNNKEGNTTLGSFFGNAATGLFNSSISRGNMTPMKLPNGKMVTPISKNDILIQITNLKKKGEVGQVKCLDAELSGILLDDDGSISSRASTILPVGGMKQNSWLDARSFLKGGRVFSDVLNIVEVGVLDLSRIKKDE